jgi:hypothetical protein
MRLLEGSIRTDEGKIEMLQSVLMLPAKDANVIIRSTSNGARHFLMLQSI